MLFAHHQLKINNPRILFVTLCISSLSIKLYSLLHCLQNLCVSFFGLPSFLLFMGFYLYIIFCNLNSFFEVILLVLVHSVDDAVNF